jgi:hypothetical protein
VRRGVTYEIPLQQFAIGEAAVQVRIAGDGQRVRDRGIVGDVATIQDVESVVAELPEVTEGERFRNRTWFVNGKGFAWERPFSKADIKRFGTATPPDGPILAVRVADLGEKEAVLATSSKALFTIPHFEGFPAVLIQLNAVAKAELRDAIVEAWLACAPQSLADTYLRK